MSVHEHLALFGARGDGEYLIEEDLLRNLPEEGILINLGEPAQGQGHDGLVRNSESARARAHGALVPGGAADGRDTTDTVLRISQSGRSAGAGALAVPIDRSQSGYGVSAGTQAQERRRRSVAASNGRPQRSAEQQDEQRDQSFQEGGINYAERRSFVRVQGIDAGDQRHGQRAERRTRGDSATPAFEEGRHSNVEYSRRGRRAFAQAPHTIVADPFSSSGEDEQYQHQPRAPHNDGTHADLYAGYAPPLHERVFSKMGVLTQLCMSETVDDLIDVFLTMFDPSDDEYYAFIDDLSSTQQRKVLIDRVNRASKAAEADMRADVLQKEGGRGGDFPSNNSFSSSISGVDHRASSEDFRPILDQRKAMPPPPYPKADVVTPGSKPCPPSNPSNLSPNASTFIGSAGGPSVAFETSKKRQQQAKMDQVGDASRYPRPKEERRYQTIPAKNQGIFNSLKATPLTYKTWALKAMNALTLIGCAAAVLRPEESTTTLMMCEAAVSNIMMMMTDDCIHVFSSYIGSVDAQGLWNAIQRKVIRVDLIQLDGMKADVLAIEFDEHGTMYARIEGWFDELCSKCGEIGVLDPTWNPDVSVLRRRLIQTLPVQMEIYARSIDPRWTLDELKDYLLESASYSDSFNSARKPTGRSNAAPGAWKKPFTGTCYNCGETGHYKNKCPKEAKDSASTPPARQPWKKKTPVTPSSDSDGVRCFNCNETGHVVANCPKPKTEKQKLYEANAKPKARAAAASAKDAKTEEPVVLEPVKGQANVFRNKKSGWTGKLPAAMNVSMLLPLACLACFASVTAASPVTAACGNAGYSFNTMHNTTTTSNSTNGTTPSTDLTTVHEHSLCFLGADLWMQATKCLDSGCTHHIFSAKYVEDNPEKFTFVEPQTVPWMPRQVGSWEGTGVPVSTYVMFKDVVPTDRGDKDFVIGPCIVSDRSEMNLISEALMVNDLDCSVVHDKQGKRIVFADGAISWLDNKIGLQFLKECEDRQRNVKQQAFEGFANFGDAKDHVDVDTSSYFDLVYGFVRDKFTLREQDQVDVPPSDAFMGFYADQYEKDVEEAVVNHQSWSVSKPFQALRGILGFRSPQQVMKVAKLVNAKTTMNDTRYSKESLQGNARLQQDPPGKASVYAPGDQLCIDPVKLPVTGFGNKTTVFFTVDSGTDLLRVHATDSKSSACAQESVQEYVRQDKVYRNLPFGRRMPYIIKSDSESIFNSAYWFGWLRRETVKTEESAPWHHRQNGKVERKIGVVWRSAIAMMYNATSLGFKLTNGRSIEEFFHFALQYAGVIDSYLPSSNLDKKSPYELSEGHAPPYHLLRGMWGAEVMVALSKDQQKEGKLSVKARPGYYMGISQYHKMSYQIYMPHSDAMIVSQDVYFPQMQLPTEKWMPVIDDDESTVEVFELIDVNEIKTFPNASLHTADDDHADLASDAASGFESEGVFVGDRDSKPAATKATKTKKTKKCKKKSKSKTITTTSAFELNQSVIVDYGSNDYYHGYIDEITATSVKIVFESDDSFATLHEEHFHLIQPDDASTTNVAHINICGQSDMVRMRLKKPIFVNKKKKPFNNACVNVQFKPSTMFDTVEQDFEDEKWYSEAVPLPAEFQPSVKEMEAANRTSFGNLMCVLATANILSAPKAFETWSKDCINSVEPDLQFGSEEWVYQALPEEVAVRSRKGVACLNLHGPPRRFIGPLEPRWFDAESKEMSTNDVVCMANGVPETYNLKQIQAMPDGKLKTTYLEAVQKEISGLEEICWDDTPPPDGAIILDTKLFMLQKMSADDSLKCKARLVVKGFMQPPDSYGTTAAPVLLEPALNCLLAVSAANDLDIQHLDYSQAFLHAPIDRELWIRMPKELGGGVKKLLRQLYGMKQAPAEYIEFVATNVTEFGLKRCLSDPCVFVLQSDDPALLMHEGKVVTDKDFPGASECLELIDKAGKVKGYQRLGANKKPLNHVLYLGQYVDDILLCSTPDNPKVKELTDFLKQREHKFTLEPLEFFLNMFVHRDRSTRTLTLSQEKHARKIVSEVFGNEVGNVKSNVIPMTDGYMPQPCEETAADRLYMTEEKHSQYRSWTASLLWISRTLPEIKYSVGQLCRHMQRPSIDHYNDLKKVCRYIAGNTDRGLKFTGDDLTIYASSDSDWGTCKATRKSCSGYEIRLGSSLVQCKSKMQTTVALSTLEAELYALVECTKSVQYYRGLLGELGIEQKEPTLILVDNQSCIGMSQSAMVSYRSRHIPLRYHFVKQCIREKSIRLEWVASAENTSDLFTKSLGKELFLKHRDTVSSVVKTGREEV